MANRVDLDQPAPSGADSLCLHCLLKPICPNIYNLYRTWQEDIQGIQKQRFLKQIPCYFFLNNSNSVVLCNCRPYTFIQVFMNHACMYSTLAVHGIENNTTVLLSMLLKKKYT